jgi:hypothetical protein
MKITDRHLAINYQLSIINYQLSIINYQLSIINSRNYLGWGIGD